MTINASHLFNIGFIVFLTGFTLLFLSILLSIVKGLREGKAKWGGLVLIGPIPIGLASDRDLMKWLIILAIIIIFLMIIWALLPITFLNQC